MSEVVLLKEPLAAEAYINKITSCDGDVRLTKKVATYPSVVGAVNGRAAQRNTLCFVDRQPSDIAVSALAGAVVITTGELASCMTKSHVFLADDPRAVFIDLVKALSDFPGFMPLSSLARDSPHVHSLAIVHPTTRVEDGVYIGAGTTIEAGCVIKSGTWIGERVIVRENTVIGCDGIALYKTLSGRVLRFPHLAGVHIHDDVEIGAGCVLPRGALSSSVIGRSSVIGNLCNLGHGAVLGERVWMSVGSLIGGNTTLGAGVTVGMGACIRDNLIVGENASVGMGSVVVKDVSAGSSVFGNPARGLPSIDAGPQR